MFTVDGDYADLSFIAHVESVDEDGYALGWIELDGDEAGIVDKTAADDTVLAVMHNNNLQLFSDFIDANTQRFNAAYKAYKKREVENRW